MKSFLPLFFGRLLTTTVPGQALLAGRFAWRARLPAKVWCYLIAVMAYWATALALRPSTVPLRNLLFYFSFALPLAALISSRSAEPFAFVSDRFILALCGLTILEAIVLNTPLAGYVSYLLPANWSSSSENVRLLGFYQRPLGIAGNASMTSGVLIFAAVLGDAIGRLHVPGTEVAGREPRRIRYRTIALSATVLVLASGAGFGLLILYLSARALRHVRFTVRGVATAAVVLAIPTIAVIGAFNYFNNIPGFDKFGANYASTIFEQKLETAVGSVRDQAGFANVLLGDQVSPATENPATSDDFGFATMFRTIGVGGVLLVLASPFLFGAAARQLPLALCFFYVCFVHYPGLLSPPGAVLFGLYLYLLHLIQASHARAETPALAALSPAC